VRLLIDSLMFSSPGGVKLRDELALAVIAKRPADWEIFWIVSDKDGDLPSEEKNVSILRLHPKHNWLGQIRWYYFDTPAIAARMGIDVILSLSGILSYRSWKSFGTITSFATILPFAPFRHRQISPVSRQFIHDLIQKRLFLTGARRADAAVMFCQRLVNIVDAYIGGFKFKCQTVFYGISDDVKINVESNNIHPYCGRPYIFYASSIYPYKNHLRLLEAYKSALEEEPSVPDLVIAGAPADRHIVQKIESFIQSRGLVDKVNYVGYLPREQITTWLYNADFNIFPSLCEANSMVLFEIMGVGGALACSNTAFDELEGGSELEFFDPESIGEIKSAILNLTRNPSRRAHLRNVAIHLSDQFSWPRVGEAVWAATREAYNSFRIRKGGSGYFL
jgi:glycosyltransferase involved in cell wall biosynthesis